MMISVYDDNLLRATCVHSSLITKRTTQYVNNVRKYLYTRGENKSESALQPITDHYNTICRPSQLLVAGRRRT